MSITHYQETENYTKTNESTTSKQANSQRPINSIDGFVHKEVSVNSISFSGRGKFRSFPKQITIDTEEVTFVETGMRYLLQKGASVVQLFDMSDGHKNYRLQFDSQNFTWTLLKVSELPR